MKQVAIIFFLFLMSVSPGYAQELFSEKDFNRELLEITTDLQNCRTITIKHNYEDKVPLILGFYCGETGVANYYTGDPDQARQRREFIPLVKDWIGQQEKYECGDYDMQSIRQTWYHCVTS